MRLPFVSASRFDDVQRLLSDKIGERDKRISDLTAELADMKRRHDVLADLIFVHQFGEAPYGTRGSITPDRDEPEEEVALDPNSLQARTEAAMEQAREGIEEVEHVIGSRRLSDLGPALERLKRRQIMKKIGAGVNPRVADVFGRARAEALAK